MIDLTKVIETTEHAIYLLETVAALIPGPRGIVLSALLARLKSSFNSAGIRQALEEVQAKYSAEAQAIADEWPQEPTKPE